MTREVLYRRMFRAAAVYNILWGGIVALFPTLFFQLFDIPMINYPFMFAGVGMFVALYGYGYWVVASDLRRYPQLAFIGCMGKIIGSLGWVVHVFLGNIPAQTLWTNVFNDFIWIPFFVSYLLWVWREKRQGRIA
jgi:hypothetical protein